MRRGGRGCFAARVLATCTALASLAFAAGADEGGADDYVDGYARLLAGDTEGAVRTLRAFLRDRPDSPLADDAQYALGEAYYRAHDYARAIREFQTVVDVYTTGDRVPTALLRQSLAFHELRDEAQARRVLKKLVAEHGTSPEAEIARKKLGAFTP